jgi:hypothetical protein
MDLPTQYRDVVDSHIDETGIEIAPALVINDAGLLIMMALAVPPTEAYTAVINEITKGASEAIFALDRFTKPGQGTTLGDVMAGHYYSRGVFKPFIIEYQHEPRILGEIVWDNEHWNTALTGELASAMQQIAPIIAVKQ